MQLATLTAEREIEILLYGAIFHLVDVATTWGAISLGAQETMVIARWFLLQYGPVGLMIQKTVVFVGAYLLWRGFRQSPVTIDYSWTIPFVFLVAGLLPAAWNSANLLIRILH